LARAGSSAGSIRASTGRPDIQPLGSVPTAPVRAAAAAPARPTAVAPAPGPRGRGRHRRGSIAFRFNRRLAAGRATVAAANAATAALTSKPAAAAVEVPVAKLEKSEKAEAPAAKAEPAEKPASSAAVKAAASSGDELDQLMASAVGSTPPKASSDLDKKLSTVQKGEAGVKVAKAEPGRQPLGRTEIQTVMKDVQGQMGDCMRKTGKGGPVDVKITVAPDGDVKSTIIKGDMAGTPTGACVDSKLKATVFPPSGGQSFDYRLVVR
jgi:hypothetical protein